MSGFVSWDSQSLDDWTRRHARGATIELAGHRTHYIEKGEGPPLILLHGLRAYAQTWESLARALGDAAPSTRPLCLQSLAVMALAVAAFRQDAAIRRHGLSPDIRLCYTQAELGDDHGRNQSKTDSGRSGLVARLR